MYIWPKLCSIPTLQYTRPIVDGPAYFSTDVETSSTMVAEQRTYPTATRMPSRKATRTTNTKTPKVRMATVLVRH